MNLQVGVKVLLQNDAGELLFIRRSQQVSTDSETRQWDIPGGRIEPDEPLLEALAREVKEETGLRLVGVPSILGAQDIFVPAKNLHVVRLTYAARTKDSTISLSDEHSEHVWLTPRLAASEVIDPYVKEIIKSITDE